MGTTQGKIVVVGLAFLLIFVSGIWMSRVGKPYNTGLFTIHKLVGLALGVFLGVTIYRTHQAAPLGLLTIAAIVVTILFFIGTVVAGGLLSIDKPMPAVVLRLHQVGPVLSVLLTAGILYLLLKGQ